MCHIKMLDYAGNDPFVRVLKSIKHDQDYIEDRKRYYPTHWEHLKERISISTNMKENDINSLRYNGWSNDSNDIQRTLQLVFIDVFSCPLNNV